MRKIMDDVFKTIITRRSVRNYTDKPVESEKLDKIIEAARFAPSATNKQPWRFIIVTDKELIKKISGCLGYINRWTVTAPLIVIGCSAKKRSAMQKVADKIIGVDFSVIDVSIALEHMVLVAQELGLYSCWIGWFHSRKIKKLVSEILPAWSIVSLLAIGYADGSFIPLERKLLPEEITIIKK
jgi:nitroreductase